MLENITIFSTELRYNIKVTINKPNQNMTVNELKNAIAKLNVATVTFTKKNGEERVMRCSINWDELLANSDKTGYSKPTREAAFDAEANDMLRVWDLDERGWRIINANTVSNIA